LAALAFGVLGYAGAAVLHASGFLAAYLAGVVLGNSRLPHGLAVRSFAEGLGWLAQIGLFVMLGLLAVPHRLPGELLPAVAVGLVLLLVARPLSVLVALTPLRMAWREQAFLSWAGLRGAVPVVLATIPVVEGVPGAARVFDAVFVLVVVFTLVQAPLLPAVARRLGLAGEGAVDLEVDSAPLGRLGAELLSLTVGSRSRLHGVEVGELRLPSPAAVTLVVREGRAFVPDATTVLRHGDELLVVTTGAARPGVERRLRAVSRGGRLAGWYGEGPGA
ncbi:MAG: cation:proton antiporter, partial [Actinomycetota bacterium]